ncbi:hypothetical protein EON63_11490, partial [archaeon]
MHTTPCHEYECRYGPYFLCVYQYTHIHTHAHTHTHTDAPSTLGQHVYRKSKLTLALKSSFVLPTARTAIICTVSPASKDTEHSVNTLRHACHRHTLWQLLRVDRSVARVATAGCGFEPGPVDDGQ